MDGQLEVYITAIKELEAKKNSKSNWNLSSDNPALWYFSYI